MRYQRGISLSGLLVWAFILILAAGTAMKIAPSVIEYYKVLKGAQGVVLQVSPGATVADVKKAFGKFAEVNGVDFSPEMLDVSKEGGQVVISFAYEKRIPLFRNVSLLIDFKGSTSPGG